MNKTLGQHLYESLYFELIERVPWSSVRDQSHYESSANRFVCFARDSWPSNADPAPANGCTVHFKSGPPKHLAAARTRRDSGGFVIFLTEGGARPILEVPAESIAGIEWHHTGTVDPSE